MQHDAHVIDWLLAQRREAWVALLCGACPAMPYDYTILQ